MKYTFDRVVRLVIGLAVCILIALLINRLSGVLLPFLIGWLIAYLVHPMVKFIQYKMRVGNRGVSIFLALLFIALIITGFVFALIPAISSEVSRATVLINDYLSKETTYQFNSSITAYLNNIISQVDIEAWTKPETIEGALEKLLPQVYSLLSGTWEIIASVFVVFIVFLYVVFILIDYEKISVGFRHMIPVKYRPLIEEILEDLEEGMNKYFRGQGLVALIVGILFAIGFTIVGLPLGITVGLFIGVLNLVPYLQTIGIVPVVLLALIQSVETGTSFWLILLGCAIVFVVVQSTQDLLLVPKIMGKAMGLNPAVILLSLSVWGSLFGLVGMIIALPCTTILISYYKRFVLREVETESGQTAAADQDDTKTEVDKKKNKKETN